MKNIAKKIIMGIIFTALIAPTLASVFGWGSSFAINENRNRLEFPDKEALESNGFISVNEWYNDNFGLRDFLIRLQHQIDYSLFRYSKELFFSSDREQKYLFYRSTTAIDQYYNELMSQETQENILNNFRQIKEQLESAGIAFKFIIAPQKNEVLSHNIQDIPVTRDENNMYYVMQEKYMETDLAVNYVNIIDELIRRNEQIPTYYYSDFHWNDWGAACAFGEVIKSYANDLGIENPYNVDTLKSSTYVPDKNFMQLSSLSVLFYDIPAEYTVGTTQEISATLSADAETKLQIWENAEDPYFDGAVLIIGDSYTPPALQSFNDTSSGIVDLFEKTYFCHWDDSSGVLQRLPEDVKLVVIETIESHYFWLDTKLATLF